MATKEQRMTGWGLYPVFKGQIDKARYLQDLVGFARTSAPLLAQGNCRSYGDACLASHVVSTLAMSHLLDFDAEQGVLRAQAGITLAEIIRFILPHGWFMPVTPGTKYTTLGGCIAADVHGKNHHTEGSIGNFVEELEIVVADGTCLRCSRTEHPELFQATLGGMGLTGFIYAVALRLKPISSAYISVHSVKTANLGETCQVFAETQEDYIYSVAWIDCLARGKQLGRSIVMLGNHLADPTASRGLVLHSSRQRNIPFSFPEYALTPWSMKLFNALYHRRQWRRRTDSTVHYDPYFYPLDTIGHWNRIYGRRGFLQYQCAVPFANGVEVLSDLLGRITARGAGSFLAVLKTFGPQEGLLSFPIPGYTLSLDFPLRHDWLIPFLHELNQQVLRVGGRVYLAKDAILKDEDFAAMYPRLDEFKRIKRAYDPEHHFRSLQSDRLGLT